MPSKTMFEVVNVGVKDSIAEIRIYDNIGIKTDETPGYFATAFGAALAMVPKNDPVKIRINSRGGALPEAQAICALILERRGRTECVIDGVCMSSATLIACSCDTVSMVEGGLYMIHNPNAVRDGDANDFRNAAKVLDNYKSFALRLYADKTSLSESELSEMMDKTTFLDAQEALELGFIDKIIEEGFVMLEPLPLHGNLSVPNKFKKLFTKGETNMPNKTNNPADPVVKDPQPQPTPQPEPPKSDPQPAPEPTPQPEPPKKDEPQADPQPISPEPPPVNQAQIAIMQAQLAALQAKQKETDKRNATKFVDSAIQAGKIDNSSKDFWVTQIMDNPEMRAELEKLPAKTVKEAPVIEPVHGSVSVKDIEEQFLALNKAGKTNEKFGLMFAHNRFLKDALATNAVTVSDDLKETFIETNIVLTEFFEPLRGFMDGFTTTWSDLPRKGKDTMQVAVVKRPDDPVMNYNPAKGLQTGSREVESIEIKLDKHKTVGLTYNSLTSNAQPHEHLSKHFEIMLQDLREAIVNSVLEIVTIDNFSGVVAAEGVESEDFDRDHVTAARKACNKAKWPRNNRWMYLNLDYEEALLNDSRLITWAGLAEKAIATSAEGILPRLLGFDIIASDFINDNSERLVGFCCRKDAIGVVGAPYKVDPAVSKIADYEVISDPVTGLSIGRQTWAEAAKRNVNVVYECLFGVGVLNKHSLLRMISES